MIRFNDVQSLICACLLAVQAAAVAAEQSQVPQIQPRASLAPIGNCVKRAELIVVGFYQTRPKANSQFEDSDQVVLVADVIKGDPSLVGTEIVVEGLDACVEPPASNIAILLAPNWKTSGEISKILAVYGKSDEIAEVRMLAAIYALPTERARLLALRDEALTGSKSMKEQLALDFKNMREPDNFDIMTGMLDSLVPQDQAQLVDAIAQTGDARAVPALLKALKSPSLKVKVAASMALQEHYPDAPGVAQALAKTDAFAAGSPQPPSSPQTRLFNTVQRVAQSIRTPRQPSHRPSDPRAAAMALIENQGRPAWIRRQEALQLADDATTAERERIVRAMLPSLMQDIRNADRITAQGGGFTDAKEALRLLQKLRHPDCLEGLLAMLPRVGQLDWRIAAPTAMAIRDLGTEARRKGTALLIDSIPELEKKTHAGTGDEMGYLLSILWLADAEGLARVDAAVPAKWKISWAVLRPLRALASTTDEGAVLVNLRMSPAGMPYWADEWIFLRLGNLREQRAIRVLIHDLNADDELVRLLAKQALATIGGPQVESELLPLLKSEDKAVRRIALDTLVGVQRERCREAAVRMLDDTDPKTRIAAIRALDQYGTMKDLDVLLPLRDRWITDRPTHEATVEAAASIRARGSK